MTPSELYKSRHRRTRAVNKKTEDASTLLRWLKNTSLATAVLSVAGALFGYGVSLALSGAFGFSSGVWYSSTLELISLCGEGFLGSISVISSRFHPKKLLLVMTAYGTATALIVLATFITGFIFFSNEQRIIHWRCGVSKWFSILKTDKKFQLSPNVFKRAGVMIVAAGVGGFLAVPAVGLVMIGILAAVSIIPLLGYGAGTAYATDLVLRPKYCVSSLQVRAQLEKGPRMEKMEIGADCVEVTNADPGETFSGRLVISRPTHVVLYRPQHDDAVMVIIKTGSMRTVHTPDGNPSP